MSKKKHKARRLAAIKAQAGAEMLRTVLEEGGFPEVLIAAKPRPDMGEFALDYFVVGAPTMTDKQIKYVVGRVYGLVTGSINKNNYVNP